VPKESITYFRKEHRPRDGKGKRSPEVRTDVYTWPKVGVEEYVEKPEISVKGHCQRRRKIIELALGK